METLHLCGLGDEGGRTLDQQIGVIAELGWSRVELRTLDERPVHELGEASLLRVTERLGKAGVSVPVVASAIGNWERPIGCPFDQEVAELDAILSVARMLGSPYVRMMSYPNDGRRETSWRDEVVRRIGALVERAEAAGIVLLLENCAGWASQHPERALDLLAAVDSPALGILFDLGNPVAYGYDGLAYLAGVLPYVRHIHVKDGVATDGGEPVFTMAGEGDADVHGCLATAIEGGYRGCLSIEPELSRVFHLGKSSGDDVLRSSFLGYAKRFERLLRRIVPGSSVREGALRMPSGVPG
ncbi:MAG: sugar phosphate isomerase/epimerase family protein [Solirubrobacterales bacterium]